MTQSAHDQCSPESVEIAWRLKCRGYDSEEAAVRALRRKVRGLKAEPALSSVRAARELLEISINLLKNHLKAIGDIYATKGEISQEHMESFMPLIAAQCPDYPEDTRRCALWSAMVYHMR